MAGWMNYSSIQFCVLTEELFYISVLVQLKAGKYHCPVTCKVFNNNSKIVAIRTTGNVYSLEAVQELNIKPKNYEDLLTGEKFMKKDIIKLNDPTDEELCKRRDIINFYHLKELRDEGKHLQCAN